jgi:Bacterial Ig-like domain (group 2)
VPGEEDPVRTASAVIIRSFITAVLGAAALTSACTKDKDPVVPDPTVTSVSISGGNTVTVGQTLQLSATANFSNNSNQSVTNTATWESATTGIATVNSSGLVTGVAPGSSDIRARFQNVTGTLGVTVNAAPNPNPVARFTVMGPQANDVDTCRLSAGGDIDCTFDGNTSTGGAGGAINQWSWRFDVGGNSGGPIARDTATFNPSTDCPGYFKVKPPQTGPGFTQMVVKLIVRNAAGVFSAETVNNNVKLITNNQCGIGF